MPKKLAISTADLQTAFNNKFKTYGRSVIKERALPDVRDGLKPVHRAIMTEMLFRHMTSKSKTVKGAKIIGAVIGNWHPHGDSAAYEAMVGMAAWWSNTMPPIYIKGNGGSVYGDPAAAMRYTEARLTPTGDAYGRKLKQGIVEYEPNFDDTAMMPTVMPAQLPYLLINGGDGIAVGVASHIPTHNPIEVINAFIAYTKNQKMTTADLLEIMPGPDFPTRGEIINKSDLLEIYENGVGNIRVRGKMRYNKKRNEISIYEVPFTAAGSMDKLVQEIALATSETTDKRGKKQAPKIAGVTEVVSHSGKDGIDITVSLKRGVDPDALMKTIFAKTRMETTLTYDFMALNNRRLKRYGLKDYFHDYLAFQNEIVINEFKMDKADLEHRMEIIRGLLILQTVIDEVVSSAKNANGKAELQEILMTGKIVDGVPAKFHKTIKQFRFTAVQAEHIANLPIYKINKMDYAGFVDEGKQIMVDLEYADGIINDPKKRKKLIIKRHQEELKTLESATKDKNSDDDYSRHTQIIDDEPSVVSKLEIPESDLFVSYDKYQYLKISEKNFDGAIKTTNRSRLGFFGTDGICWNLHLEQQKPTVNNGTLIQQLITPTTPIVGWTSLINSEDERFGLFVYKDGNVRLSDMRKYLTKTKATKVGSGKGEGELAAFYDIPEDAVGVTINGQTFAIDQFSVQGITGHGKHMLDLPDDGLVEAAFITDESQLPKKRTKVAASKTKSKSSGLEGMANFKADGTLAFSWDSSEPDADSIFSLPYHELLKSQLLLVRPDGRAKRIDGSQFKVSTRRQQIQADKAGEEIMFLGLAPETMLARYTDGTQKRVETKLISVQGKAGGGVRAFYTKKHELESVVDGSDSDVELVSLATQPK